MVKGKYITGVLSTVASMPFLTVAELAVIVGQHASTIRDTLHRLEEAVLVEAITHAMASRARATRWFLTPAGITELARRRRLDESPDDLLKGFPLTTQWRRNLLGRLDAVAVINRMAQDTVRGSERQATWRWERRGALDVAYRHNSGKTVGVVRLGPGLSGGGIASRMKTLQKLHERRELHAALIIVPGQIDMHRIRHMVEEHRMLLFVALEPDLIQAPPSAPLWHELDDDELMTLDEVLDLAPQADLPRTRQSLQRASMPATTLSEDVGEMDMLASKLTVPAKHMLDLLHDWPLVSTSQMPRMLGISEGHMRRTAGQLSALGLIHRLRIGRTAAQRHRNESRICLSNAGLRYIARRDRSSLTDLIARWSVVPDLAGDEVFQIPGHRIDGKKLQTLAKELRHTTETYEVVSLIMDACYRSRSWKAVQMLPAHRWERRYRYGTRKSRRHRDIRRAIKPDAVFLLENLIENRHESYILEYERRATVPARMEQRIQRYRTYYGSQDTTHDFPDRPTLLVVFQKLEDASRFVSYALHADGEPIPMLVSSIEEIERNGNALGSCWMMPWRLDEGSLPIWALARALI